MKKIYREVQYNKGITIITLVVIIVVLLILAGITIGSITSDNGVIKEATTAKEKAEKAGVEEQIEMAVIKAEQKYRNPTLDNVIDEIKNNGVISDASQVNRKSGAVTSDLGYVIEGKLEDYIGISASDIAKAEDKSKYYGATVTGYTCANSAGVNSWKIFYADSSNIYLIADDYISYEYAPDGKKGSSVNKGSTDYKLNFTNILSDYLGSSDITDSTIKALNSSYFNYLTINKVSSTNNNMKAVAYMLDTSVWSVFAGDKEEYAIGGPTAELLFKSYNEKYGTNYQAQASSVSGYQISKDGGVNWANYYGGMLDANDSLYIVRHSDKANAMWLASPANGANQVMYLNINSDVSFDNYNGYHIGFRPIVCLKSNVQLKAQEDGTYAIK